MPIVKRDPRFNSSDGLARQAPDVKVSGTSLVAKVLGHSLTQHSATGGPVRFTIEEGNRAKKIDHDAPPK